MNFRDRARILPRVGDRTVDASVAELDNAARKLGSDEMSHGRLIEGVEVPASGTFAVEHGLGRLPRGWLVADCMSAPPQLYRTKWDAKRITFGVIGSSASNDYYEEVSGIVIDDAGTVSGSATAHTGSPGWAATKGTGTGLYLVTLASNVYTSYSSGWGQLENRSDAWRACVQTITLGPPMVIEFASYTAGALADFYGIGSPGRMHFAVRVAPYQSAVSSFSGQTITLRVF